MATHSCILAWRIPWAKEAGGFTVHGNYTEKKKGETFTPAIQSTASPSTRPRPLVTMSSLQV